MRTVLLSCLAAAGLVIAATAAVGQGPAPTTVPSRAVAPAHADDGAALYDRFCLACHGSAGDGRGPGAPWLWPRPRDFTAAQYKWRSTPTGYPPTDRDLSRAIRYGARGTSMHGFANTLTDAQVAALVAHLRAFAPARFARVTTPLPDPVKPAIDASDVARGKALYASLGCVKCHGETGKGDGEAKALTDNKGLPAAPFDMTKFPLRRPMPPGTDKAASIYQTLVTGLSGTPMPSYEDAAPARDLWAVAAYVATLSPDPGRVPLNNSAVVHPIAAELDKKHNITKTGYWPGNPTDPEAVVWGRSIQRMGEPPEQLAPAQASLEARRCARCHNKQYREWNGSIHSEAGSDGLHAQLIKIESKPAHGAFVESCQRCHNPLVEQMAMLRSGHRRGGDDSARDYAANPEYSAALRDEGLTCASCHVRGWKRYGPKLSTDNRLLDLPGYPVTELAIYERSDFCLACHQLTPSNLVAGRPLLNTYREWLEGPYMKRGIQCQHCHMPNREHSFKGIHDPETFRQGYTLTARAARSKSGVVSVRARMTNSGAGHYLPTTPTPAAFLRIRLIDDKGRLIEGAVSEKRIGRHIEFRGGFRDIEDTRIKPGETLEHARGWKNGNVSRAVIAEITVRVEPDEYYERFYQGRLDGELTAEQRRMFKRALKRARSAHFVAEVKRIRITDL